MKQRECKDTEEQLKKVETRLGETQWKQGLMRWRPSAHSGTGPWRSTLSLLTISLSNHFSFSWQKCYFNFYFIRHFTDKSTKYFRVCLFCLEPISS